MSFLFIFSQHVLNKGPSTDHPVMRSPQGLQAYRLDHLEPLHQNLHEP